jgi:hypothetical protein
MRKGGFTSQEQSAFAGPPTDCDKTGVDHAVMAIMMQSTINKRPYLALDL